MTFSDLPRSVVEDVARLRKHPLVPPDIPIEVFEACLKTKEWTPLEPGGIEHKYYAPGVGLVLIEGHHGKKVITELVAIE